MENIIYNELIVRGYSVDVEVRRSMKMMRQEPGIRCAVKLTL